MLLIHDIPQLSEASDLPGESSFITAHVTGFFTLKIFARSMRLLHMTDSHKLRLPMKFGTHDKLSPLPIISVNILRECSKDSHFQWTRIIIESFYNYLQALQGQYRSQLYKKKFIQR